MSQRDDGKPERPASTNIPAAAPRTKPAVPGAPPRPEAPPPVEANPFLPASASKISSSKIDAGWGALEDVTESLEPAPSAEALPDDPPSARTPSADPAPPPRISPPPPPPIAIAEPMEEVPVAADDVERAKPQDVAKPDSTLEDPPFKTRSRGKVIAVVLVAVALGGGGFAYQSQVAARSARAAKTEVAPPETAQPPEPVLTATPAPPPTHTTEPPPSASAAKKPGVGAGGAAPAASIDPAARAYLDGTQLPPGRKLIVDGRVVGTSPRKVAVRCGRHRIQIGDQAPESIDFPCGGEVEFTE
ncbi:MAG: hypothetical protein KF795_00780 [Labilithrix sp.]|nr:hypothetical protein [Labilithrix sp.]